MSVEVQALRQYLIPGAVLALLVAALALTPSDLMAAGKDKGPPDQALARCGPKTKEAETPAPPHLADDVTPGDDPGPACDEGQVAHPEKRSGHKGKAEKEKKQASASHGPAHYFYATGGQAKTAIGAIATLTEWRPYLAGADYHTLAEVAVLSGDRQQIVEVGWIVDRGVNNGSSAAHLFVYHWVNGGITCYNACGWVQVSATRYPGMKVSSAGLARSYAIEYYQGNWWVWYQSEWIGFFPGRLWSAGFTQIDRADWFGEVAAIGSAPCTDMGSGVYAGQAGAATIAAAAFLTTPTTKVKATPTLWQTKSAYYTVRVGSAPNNYSYGGRGAC